MIGEKRMSKKSKSKIENIMKLVLTKGPGFRQMSYHFANCLLSNCLCWFGPFQVERQLVSTESNSETVLAQSRSESRAFWPPSGQAGVWRGWPRWWRGRRQRPGRFQRWRAACRSTSRRPWCRCGRWRNRSRGNESWNVNKIVFFNSIYSEIKHNRWFRYIQSRKVNLERLCPSCLKTWAFHSTKR